jgi:hypothetical protein
MCKFAPGAPILLFSEDLYKSDKQKGLETDIYLCRPDFEDLLRSS